jgi:hypothetical protein
MWNVFIVACFLTILVVAWAGICASMRRQSSSGESIADAEEHAENYLKRIIELTGAAQMGRHYCILEVASTRFEVHDSYVSRTPIGSDCRGGAKAAGGTCFYIPNERMPVSEKIATALLQLKNNPGLFDRWATQNGTFKPDGELFRYVTQRQTRSWSWRSLFFSK